MGVINTCHSPSRKIRYSPSVKWRLAEIDEFNDFSLLKYNF